MQVPDSIIDPSTAASGVAWLIAFRDDDWDHWSSPADMQTYLMVRDADAGRWRFGENDEGGWDYADDEIVVLKQP